MDRFYRPAFTPDASFRCVKPFVMSGRAYRLGDDVATSDIETRRLRQMYDSRMIEIATSADTAGKAKASAPKKEPVAKAAKKETSPTIVEAPQETTPALVVGTGPRAEHRGFGRYVVVAADGSESGQMTKAEAERLVGSTV